MTDANGLAYIAATETGKLGNLRSVITAQRGPVAVS